MKYEDIVELKKRMDFNLTEPETLVELVKDAASSRKSTNLGSTIYRTALLV